jgi:hypothetical protein
MRAELTQDNQLASILLRADEWVVRPRAAGRATLPGLWKLRLVVYGMTICVVPVVLRPSESVTVTSTVTAPVRRL